VSVSSCSRQQIVSISAQRRVGQHVSARQYQSLLRDLRKCGIRISRSSSCAARSRGRRGAGSEVTRDEWYFVERARRCKQSARSRAVHRLVIPVYVTPLLQAWQSAAAKSQVRRSAALQSAVPVSCSYLLSQWRGRYLSQVQVALYPDPHAAPFTPTSATSSSVAQRVVERRCVRHPTSFSTGVLKLSQCVLIPLCTFVKRWHGRWQCYHPALGPSAAALKLLRCTFTSLRMVLRRWWSRDLFALHSDLLYPSEFAPLNFIVGIGHQGLHPRIFSAMPMSLSFSSIDMHAYATPSSSSVCSLRCYLLFILGGITTCSLTQLTDRTSLLASTQQSI
jgi:hypothetical protein